MLDMGFVRDIALKPVPTKRQNLMFSATFSKILKN
jgi:ATP-dependent RNA helicase RhlE